MTQAKIGQVLRGSVGRMHAPCAESVVLNVFVVGSAPAIRLFAACLPLSVTTL